MEKLDFKNWWLKLKKVVAKKDKYFWLLIFVVVSTLSIFIVWSFNLENIFSNKVSLAGDFEFLNISESKKEVNETLEGFAVLLNSIESQNAFEIKDESTLDETDLDKIKKAIDDKIIQNKNEELVDNIITNINNSSSLPILSEELDESDQEIAELKRRIKELEEKINNY